MAGCHAQAPFISVDEAAQAVACGQIIAYPTEGVVGLGCDPESEQAVSALVQLKGRSLQQGVLLVAASFEQCRHYCDEISDESWRQISSQWPGPISFAFPKTQLAPAWVTGCHNTIVVRVSSHPVVRALCERLQHPLVSTSANRHGEPAYCSLTDCYQAFSTEIAGVVAGPLGGRQRPCPIVDARTGRVLRR